MNVIKPTNTSGFYNKAVFLPLPAYKYFTLSQYKSLESELIHA